MSLTLKNSLHSRRPGINMYQPTAGDGCVFWFPGQDDAYSTTIRDRSGNGNNGTITNATWTKLSSGAWCLTYDGTGDYVSMNGLATTVASDNAGSVGIWVNFTAGIAAGNANMFSVSKGDTTNYLQLNVSSNKLRFAIDINVAGIFETEKITTPTYAGVWHLVFITCNAATTKLYVDGVEPALDTNTDSGTWFNDISNLGYARVGGMYYDSAESSYLGKSALPRIFNQVLTASQIMGIFNRERSLFGV